MFPVIRHINDVLPHIQDAPEITVKERDGYTVINYQVVMKDTFPDGESLKSLIRRECRGLIFHTETGVLLRRPFHKFFNINERASTHQDTIDLREKHCIPAKLDGSMFSPFICNGKINWGTRAGVTDVADQCEQFLAANPQYNDFVLLLMQNGHTPMFEWCSRKQRIVLDYGQEDQLVLTAIRVNLTGEYWDKFQEDNLAAKYNIPTVDLLGDSTSDVQSFINNVRGLENTEGFIIRFESGRMMKIKCDWYCALHKTLEHLIHEKDVIRLILDQKLDDAKAILPEDRIRVLDGFSDVLYLGIKDMARRVEWKTIELYDNHNGSRKDFAIAVKDLKEKNFMFKALDFMEQNLIEDNNLYTFIFEYILTYVRDGSSSQTKVNDMRWIWNDVKWEEYG